jgi:prephenate dehydrogenase
MTDLAPHDPSRAPSDDLGSLQICVVGLGLMGGSLAMALRRHVFQLRGVDIGEGARRAADNTGLFDVVTDALAKGVADANVIVLAAPVRTNLRLLREVGPLLREGSLIIDLSSTKRAIVTAMAELPEHVLAVGGHPMCGKERAGIGSADGALFRGRPFVLCQTARTRGVALDRARSLVRALGALPVDMDPDLHDDAVARVSHLPYLLAATLVASVSELSSEAMALAASGYRDVSRLAASDADMMADVLLTNSTYVQEAIAAARKQLDGMADLIARQDVDALKALCALIQADRAGWKIRGPR